MKPLRPLVLHSRETQGKGMTAASFGDVQFIDRAGEWAGWSARIRIERGHVSSWHCHPASDTYVFILSGTLTIHFGDNGQDSIIARKGDLVLIPPQLVHRETTGSNADLDAIVFRIGSPPEQIDVEAP